MAMIGGAQAQQVLDNLSALGARKLGALAIIGLLVVSVVGLGAYYLSRPDMETLYTGLDRQDVTRIGAALTEAGINFDVNTAGDTVSTPFSQTAGARMLLAEKGLPRSENAGYELFDALGSMGLTSFMQEVTRVRALEGELARTIQTLKDVRAARVHIVLPEPGTFRREMQKPSASVVIRTDNEEDFTSAQAIRHLVASAIPGMNVDEVTVLNTDGTLLASGDDSLSAAPSKLLGIEGIVSRSVEDQIRRTLAPYLGIGNFQSSVNARLDTDRKSTSARTFDPDGRVERSTRTVRETGQTNDKAANPAATVEQNLPQAADAATAGTESSEAKERREELTNYEINETTVQTVSDGYDVKRLSVAVVVNSKRLKETLGENPTDADVAAALANIKALVASAAGFTESRGDQLEVTAVDFVSNGEELAPVEPVGLGEMFVRQSGTLINALTILVVAVLLIWFGLRPAIRAIAAPSASADGSIELENAGMGGDLGNIGGMLGNDMGGMFDGAGGMFGNAGGMDADLLEDLTRSQANSPQARLEKLIDFDEAQAASILKHWIHQKEAA